MLSEVANSVQPDSSVINASRNNGDRYFKRDRAAEGGYSVNADMQLTLPDPSLIPEAKNSWLPSTIPPIDARKPADIPDSFIPRDVQWTMLDGLTASYRAGNRSPLIMAMTGSGKTLYTVFLFWRMLRKNPNQRLLFLVPRISLVNQTVESFEYLGISCSVIWKKDPRFNASAQVHVGSLDTMWRRVLSDNPHTSAFFGAFKFNCIAVDEAHKRNKHLDVIPCDWRFGLSASPFTKGLSDDYDDLIKTQTSAELIESGVIRPIVAIASLSKINRENLRIGKTGEYLEEDETLAVNEIAGNVIDDLLNEPRMQGRIWIAFCRTIETCEHIHNMMLEAGINAGIVHSNMTTKQCEAVLDSFKAGMYDGVISIGKLSEGFDYSRVSMMLCLKVYAPAKNDKTRPNNLNGWVQEPGRARREDKTPSAPKESLFVDYGNNWIRYGSPDRFIDSIKTLDDYAPERKEVADKEPKPIECPQCRWMIDKGNVCPSCGHEIQECEVLVEGAPVKFLDGKLVTISDTDYEVEAIRSRKRFTMDHKKAAYAGILALADKIDAAKLRKNQPWHREARRNFVNALYRNQFNKWPSEKTQIPYQELKQIKPEENAWFRHFDTRRRKPHENKYRNH